MASSCRRGPERSTISSARSLLAIEVCAAQRLQVVRLACDVRTLNASQSIVVLRFRTILLLACAPVLAQQYTISTIAGGANLNSPTSVTLDSESNIYVGGWSGLIRKIWAGGGAVTTIAGAGILGL